MTYSLFKQLASATALGFSLLISSLATAETAVEQSDQSRAFQTESISIAYSSAELSTAKGRATLYNKIKHAAKQVCGPTSNREAGGLQLASRNRSCYDETMALAMDQIGNGQLAALMQ
ncbi:MAG: UrcA family protein [Pseudomonadota bacterium]